MRLAKRNLPSSSLSAKPSESQRWRPSRTERSVSRTGRRSMGSPARSVTRPEIDTLRGELERNWPSVGTDNPHPAASPAVQCHGAEIAGLLSTKRGSILDALNLEMAFLVRESGALHRPQDPDQRSSHRFSSHGIHDRAAQRESSGAVAGWLNSRFVLTIIR